MRFASRAHMLAYLRERFPDPRMTYSLCVVHTREPRTRARTLPLPRPTRPRSCTCLRAIATPAARRSTWWQGCTTSSITTARSRRPSAPTTTWCSSCALWRCTRTSSLITHNVDCVGCERDMVATLLQLVVDEWNASVAVALDVAASPFFVTDSSSADKCSFHVHPRHGV